MYFVDECPICEGGLRGFRTCPQGHVVVLCDECEALWTSPAETRAHFSAPTAVLCPVCRSDLFDTHAHWSDTREIDAAGWQGSVTGTWERHTGLPPRPGEEE
jgi:hypothetical protein